MPTAPEQNSKIWLRHAVQTLTVGQEDPRSSNALQEAVGRCLDHEASAIFENGKLIERPNDQPDHESGGHAHAA
jgi:hypothetical protein